MSAYIPCAYGSVGRWNPQSVRLAPPIAAIRSSSDEDDYVGSPILGYDLAFCVSRPRGLLALHAATGAEVWRLKTERAWGSCQLYGEHLLTTPRPGVLAVIDPASGSQVDIFGVDDLSLYNGVAVDGRIVSPLKMGTLAAWDTASRDFAWRVPSGWRSQVLAAGVDTVCVAEDSAYVAIDLKTGIERWRCEVTELGRHSAILWGERAGATAGRPVVVGETMFGGVTGGWLLALDLTSGAPRWQLHVGGLAPRNYTAVPDGVLVSLSDDELIAVDAATGATVSRSPLIYPANAQGGGPFAPIAVTEECVWTVDKATQLVAISRADARVTICFKLGSRVSEPPVIGDGKLFVVGSDGRLTVFAESG